MNPWIFQIAVTVNTTHDDKDDNLWWEIEILKQDNPIASVVGARDPAGPYPKETWRNCDTRDIIIPLSPPYAFIDRFSLRLRVTQHYTGKNNGWEGNIEANAQLADGRSNRPGDSGDGEEFGGG